MNSQSMSVSECLYYDVYDRVERQTNTYNVNTGTSCSNNPVMYVDPDGHSVIVGAIVAGAFIGGALNFVSSILVQLSNSNGDWNVVNMKKARYDAVWGAISGAGADNVAAGAHVTKYVNSRNILRRTINNGTKKRFHVRPLQ